MLQGVQRLKVEEKDTGNLQNLVRFSLYYATGSSECEIGGKRHWKSPKSRVTVPLLCYSDFRE